MSIERQARGLFEGEEKPARKDERKMLIEAAKKMGIETEGRDIKEIAREVLEKIEGKDS